MFDGCVVRPAAGAGVPLGGLALTRVVQAIQPGGIFSQQYLLP